MRFAKLLFAVLCCAAIGQGQGFQCQQQCTNTYNTCVSTADQQLNQCLAVNEAGRQQCSSCVSNRRPGENCPYCAAATGCPNVIPSCNTDDCCSSVSSSQVAQCNSDHDLAVSICSFNYSDCVTNCGEPELPAYTRQKQLKRPRQPLSDVTWALLIRNLSRPGKLTPSSP